MKKKNYRPIALVTPASKMFKLCLSKCFKDYLCTHAHQFAFKSKHSTECPELFMETQHLYYVDDTKYFKLLIYLEIS